MSHSESNQNLEINSQEPKLEFMTNGTGDFGGFHFSSDLPDDYIESHGDHHETSHFFNRDLSWLDFNNRVLYQAMDDKTHPLLERVRFLSIYSSNLDEFFMKRVGYLKRIVEKNIPVKSPDGLQPIETLKKCREKINLQLQVLEDIYQNTILPELYGSGICIQKWEELNEEEQAQMTDYFRRKVFPILTPLAVDPSHPFPFLSNLSSSLGIKLHVPKHNQELFARIKIPTAIPQWAIISGSGSELPIKLISLKDLIRHHLSELFPEMVIDKVTEFRVTRNVDLDQVAEDPDDLLEVIEEELRLRRLANVVRVEIEGDTDPWISELLEEELELHEEDFYQLNHFIDFGSLSEIANLNIPELRYKPWKPVTPPALSDESLDIFQVMRSKDFLVHHPYESFSASVEKFIRQAVEDPHVLAIKMTVYRTDEKSPIIPLLIKAAEKGKQVVCVVEVKARFDEAKNLFWAEKLEKAGVHVVYGVVGLKTHTKIALVVREEHDDFKFYAHIGTGNYNSSTAKLYTDLGLFTTRPDITKELIQIFNYLTGLSLKRNYKNFLVSPINMRERFEELIETEIEEAKQGNPAHMILKMNSFEDPKLCEKLYQASQAGVEVDLIVRGFCVLKPGIEGLSENIRVISIIGRFLEHSRIYYFRHGAKQSENGQFLIGSADWMPRNLNNRVETIIPLKEKSLKKLCWDQFQIMLHDYQQAWDLHPDGNYKLRSSDSDENLGTQDQLMKWAKSL